MEMQQIHTPRMELVPLLRAHAAELFGAFRDPDIYRFIARKPPSALFELEDRYSRLEARKSEDGHELWLNWAVKLRESGRLVGLVEVTIQSEGKALLAYLFAPSAWGKGYANESCSRVITDVSERAGVCTFEATVDTRNLRSRRLLERLHFQFIEERESDEFIGGEKSREMLYRCENKASHSPDPNPVSVTSSE